MLTVVLIVCTLILLYVSHAIHKNPLFSLPTCLSCLETALAPINHQIGPIDITPGPRTKHHNRPGQLFRNTHSPHRIPLAPRPPRFFQPLPLIENRIHIPRRYGINSDTVNGPLRS